MAHSPTQPRMSLTAGKSIAVECLGMTFTNDNERRTYFRAKLREFLSDPDFRAQDGFPEGSDDAIVEMSDPPYFTACPNPFLEDFVRINGNEWDHEVPYSRAPLALDVSVGKTDALYKAHGYHTKVPHKAIVPCILHYTQPGDLVLDAFSGSGMTGVAAQYCAQPASDYIFEIDEQRKGAGLPPANWGARKIILNDLSPAAAFIASNYLTPIDPQSFSAAAGNILKAVSTEIGWMYSTLHTDGTVGEIEFTVWSQVYGCPECSSEIVFSEEAHNEDTGGVKDEFACPGCGASLTKKKLSKVSTKSMDRVLGTIVETPKRKPVLISYRSGTKRFTKTPDDHDIEVLRKIDELDLPLEVPIDRIPTMHMTHERAKMSAFGITHVHQFFVPRAAHAMGWLWHLASKNEDPRLRAMLIYAVEQAIWSLSVLNRYRPSGFSQFGQYMTGIYYVASQHAECSPSYVLQGKFERLAKAFSQFSANPTDSIVTVGTAAHLGIPDNCVDYVFTDPPFGENIYYADLNFLVESWHGVQTSPELEAIVDKHKKKTLIDYQELMQSCFVEYFRVLKPGRWMTVAFSNSKASVWNAIQVSLQQAGFVVAEVTSMDKIQGSYRQVTSANAVKQDLVVSCYKPNGGLEDRFHQSGGTEDSAWDFVQTHLKNLAVTKSDSSENLEPVAERDPRRIFDRLVAWFVRHGTPVPISSAEFQDGARQRFPERDGMIFLPNQVDEYDKKRLAVGQAPQRDLFVDDERSAIDWLSDFLRLRPATYQEIHPEFTRQTGAGWRKHEEKPELVDLLEDNFLRFDGLGPVPPQIHQYLSSNWKDLRNLAKDDPALTSKAKDRWYLPDPAKQQDVEKRREKALLKDFERYRAHGGRKLKEIRLEVLRTGFKNAWASRDYQTIIDVADKIAEDIWQEDEKLLTFYDMAGTRLRAGK